MGGALAYTTVTTILTRLFAKRLVEPRRAAARRRSPPACASERNPGRAALAWLARGGDLGHRARLGASHSSARRAVARK